MTRPSDGEQHSDHVLKTLNSVRYWDLLSDLQFVVLGMADHLAQACILRRHCKYNSGHDHGIIVLGTASGMRRGTDGGNAVAVG